MNRHMKHLNNLFKIALDVVPVAAAKIAATIVIDNKNVSYGVNSYKTSPFQKKYGKNDSAICVHAEIAAIKNALNRLKTKDLSNATLYVSRAKNDGGEMVFGLAKPCSGCCRAIAAFSIKKVYFSLDNGQFDCL